MIKVRAFVDKLIDIAQNHKTLYVLGCFGAPLVKNERFDNVSRYKTNYAYNMDPIRSKMIDEAANQDPPVYGFDCVCLGKGLYWGWNGDPNHQYGGAIYATNGLNDIDEGQMIESCRTIGTDMSRIPLGAAVWLPGHIGYYIGDGKVVECTPRWKNGVQITNLSARKWRKWGLLPWVDYEEEKSEKKTDEVSSWAKDAQAWVMEQGISDGKRPQDPVTRQEVWTMLHRMSNKGA